MEVNKDLAMKLWNDIFGNKEWAQDCYGTWMYRDDYGDSEKTRNNRPNGTGKFYLYGWEIDHIRPKSDFKNESDSNFFNNFEPVQILNNRKKKDSYPSFTIDGRNYKVVECDICSRNGEKGYGIFDVNLGKRIDWKYTKNMYYGN